MQKQSKIYHRIIYGKGMLETRLDSGEIFKHERTPEGFLRIWMAVSKVGDLQYYDSVGNPYTEYLSQESLFDSKSIETSWGKPITFGDHPKDKNGNYHLLNSSNTKPDIVGMTMQSHLPDDDRLNVLAVIFDQEAIEGIESGIRQVSAAYGRDTRLDSGKLYQINRQYNQYSVLRKGRAGKKASVYFDSFKVDILGGAIIHNQKGEIISQKNGDRTLEGYNKAKHLQILNALK